MNARTQFALPELGSIVEGGHFHGVFMLGTELWGEVTAPKEAEISGLPWMKKPKDLPGARSDFDGLANTEAMLKADSPLAQAVRALRTGGFDDWYLPARGGLLLQWANLAALREAEDFEAAWYWSSTQCGRYNAFNQNFGYGDTDYDLKHWEGCRARPVRRFRIG